MMFRSALILLMLLVLQPGRALVVVHPDQIEAYQRHSDAVPFVRISDMGGGTGVAHNWILTAAHVAAMVIPGVTRVDSRAGSHEVVEVLLAKGFRDPGGGLMIANDIALIGIADPLADRDLAQPVCDVPAAGTEVMIIGAGDVRDTRGNPISGAEDGTLLIGGNAIANADEDWLTITLKDAGEYANGAIGAGGDSGGPMLLGDRELGWQVAAVSSHEDVDNGNRVDRYTTLRRHCDWISSVIRRPPERARPTAGAVESKHPAQQVALAWINAFNDGGGQMENFYRTQQSQRMSNEATLAERMRRYAALHADWGPLTVREIRSGPNEAHSIIVVNSANQGPMALVFETVNEDGAKLDVIGRIDQRKAERSYRDESAVLPSVRAITDEKGLHLLNLDQCHNIADLRRLAKRKLPAPIFHYMDGGSDDEFSLANNTAAFDKYQLQPRYLRDVSSIDLTTRVLGADLKVPFYLSPTGMSRLFHHHREAGVARAAEKSGTLYSLSTLGTTSIEDVAAAVSTPKMFQIYIHKDRGLTTELADRCAAAGYQALCLTVDTPLAGNRERDHVHGMQMPPRFGLSEFLSFVLHPGWSLNYLRDSDFQLANIAHRVNALDSGAMGLMAYVNQQLDRSVTWDDAAWLIEKWDGPFAIKGIQTADDAAKAVDIGASAIMISNHGGRQLDCTPAPVDCVAPIRDRIGDALELIVDGGVRRGSHVIKALSLGANACSIGRGYLFGLGAGGQPGVERALALLTSEIERDLALLGCRDIAELREGGWIST